MGWWSPREFVDDRAVPDSRLGMPRTRGVESARPKIAFAASLDHRRDMAGHLRAHRRHFLDDGALDHAMTVAPFNIIHIIIP